MNIMTVGFFLYADRGGIKVWNVGMVTIINTIYTWIILDFIQKALGYEGHPEGMEPVGKTMWITFVVLEIWILVALIASALEQKASPSGTSSETAPLV
jgi:hypothetical protein